MDKIFADGFYFDRKDNAPDFVIGSVSVNIHKALDFLREHANEKGYVNLDIKRSKGGKVYMELNTWTPNQGQAQQAAQTVASNADMDQDIPF